MGISCVASYRGAQVLEALGLGAEVMELCFPAVPSRIGGADLADIEQLARARVPADRRRRCPTTAAFASARQVSTTRTTRWRCARRRRRRRPATRTRTASGAAFRAPTTRSRSASCCASRMPAQPVPLEEVEPASEIVKRFVSTAMSLGALSPEAHEALAIAMNQIGARSNSGEGGEDPMTLRRQRWRAPRQQGQAGRLRPLRRDPALPEARRRAGDQDRAGLQARRGRPAAGHQGDEPHRAPAPRAAGHAAHLAAAASRHLLDRGPGAAHPRPEDGQPARARRRQAGLGGGRRHDRRRRRQGARRLHPHLRPRRRHRRLAAFVDQERRRAVGARPGRDAAGAGGQPAARARQPAHRRRPAQRARHRDRGAARRRGVRLRHRACWSRSAATWRGSATSTPARPASPRSARTCARSSRAGRSTSSTTCS